MSVFERGEDRLTVPTIRSGREKYGMMAHPRAEKGASLLYFLLDLYCYGRREKAPPFLRVTDTLGEKGIRLRRSGMMFAPVI